MSFQKKFLQFLIMGLIFTTFPACLKTRAQLKKDDPETRLAANTNNSNSNTASADNSNSQQPQGQYVIDEIKAEITRLTGRIEDLERAQQQGSATQSKEQSAETKKLEARVVELEAAQVNLIEQLKKIQASIPPADNIDLFKKGAKEYEAENYAEAIKSFSDYLKAPNGKYAEEAVFLRGNSYFLSKNYKKAIVDLSVFPEKYTKSSRMPQALYKIGLSFEAMGNSEDAAAFFQELQDKFPKSEEAKALKKKKSKKKKK